MHQILRKVGRLLILWGFREFSLTQKVIALERGEGIPAEDLPGRCRWSLSGIWTVSTLVVSTLVQHPRAPAE